MQFFDNSKLLSPNKSKIIGARLLDGSLTKFSFGYSTSRIDSLIVYEIPNNLSDQLLHHDGVIILVDEDGNQWASSDVEYFSTPFLKSL